MINSLIWWLTGASTATAFIAAAVLLSRGLARRYPMLVAMLLGAFFRGTILLWVKFSGQGYDVYAQRWAALAPLAVALHLAATLELYVRMCSHFKNIRNFATGLGAGMALISATVAGLSAAYLHAPWKHIGATVSRVYRNEALGCLIFILLSVLFFSQFDFQEMRKNVRHHVVISAAFFAVLFVANVTIEAGAASYAYALAYQLLVNIGPIGCSVAWVICLRRDGETWLPFHEFKKAQGTEPALRP